MLTVSLTVFAKSETKTVNSYAVLCWSYLLMIISSSSARQRPTFSTTIWLPRLRPDIWQRPEWEVQTAWKHWVLHNRSAFGAGILLCETGYREDQTQKSCEERNSGEPAKYNSKYSHYESRYSYSVGTLLGLRFNDGSRRIRVRHRSSAVGADCALAGYIWTAFITIHKCLLSKMPLITKSIELKWTKIAE